MKLEYKGYVGTVNFCEEDNLYHGKIEGLPKTYINYHGESMEKLKKDFMEAVDFFLLPSEDSSDLQNVEIKQVI
jgi:predicted HicB family RNase H-like nuclease